MQVGKIDFAGKPSPVVAAQGIVDDPNQSMIPFVEQQFVEFIAHGIYPFKAISGSGIPSVSDRLPLRLSSIPDEMRFPALKSCIPKIPHLNRKTHSISEHNPAFIRTQKK
jgi:hypothetical protein